MYLSVKLLCYLLACLAGACIGSFCNVLIYRIPRKLNFVTGRSACPACGHLLGPLDMVPLLSRVFLRGKCRYCGAPVSARYSVGEALCGFFAVYACVSFGFSTRALIVFVASCILYVVALIDADTQEIPDGLVIALAMVGLAAIFLKPDVSVWARLIGAVCVSLPMFLLERLIPTCFGGGDIKLCAAAGFLLGWKLMLVGFFIALVLGGGYGAFLLLSGKKGGKDHFAFGPALAAGIAGALYFGNGILAWYLQLL